jgi:hypothetical protein
MCKMVNHGSGASAWTSSAHRGLIGVRTELMTDTAAPRS